MKYNVQISPDAKGELSIYLNNCINDYGNKVAEEFIDAYESCLNILENTPYASFEKLEYIPDKYRLVHIWKHYWAIFQIKRDRNTVIIDYIIDDRMNYGRFIH